MSRSRGPVAMSQLTGAWIASRRGQIHVYRLHWSISPGAVRKYFGKFGQVDSVHVPYDMDTGLSKGFGFIRMADNEVVPKILDHKHHMIGDFNILVTSTINWRKTFVSRGSPQEGSVNKPPPDLGSHDASGEWSGSSTGDDVMINSTKPQWSSSVDPPASGNPETTPTDRQTPPTSDIHSDLNSSSSVDPPSVEDTPIQTQTNSST